MVLRLIPRSPRWPGLFATVALWMNSTRLDASVGAPGPHGFAVRVGIVRRSTPQRPSHPAPHVRDDHDTPLYWVQDGAGIEVIWVKREAEYFCKLGWTAFRWFARRAAAPFPVILRESGGSSTPRPFGSITDVSEYWVARFRGRWRLECVAARQANQSPFVVPAKAAHNHRCLLSTA